MPEFVGAHYKAVLLSTCVLFIMIGISTTSWILCGIGSAIAFMGIYDRCPIWKAITGYFKIGTVYIVGYFPVPNVYGGLFACLLALRYANSVMPSAAAWVTYASRRQAMPWIQTPSLR